MLGKLLPVELRSIWWRGHWSHGWPSVSRGLHFQSQAADGLPGASTNLPFLLQLLPHIPPMVASLVKEDSNSGTSCLEQLAELVHCMVFRFPGFPDLYEPVVEAIKVSAQLLGTGASVGLL